MTSPEWCCTGTVIVEITIVIGSGKRTGQSCHLLQAKFCSRGNPRLQSCRMQLFVGRSARAYLDGQRNHIRKTRKRKKFSQFPHDITSIKVSKQLNSDCRLDQESYAAEHRKRCKIILCHWIPRTGTGCGTTVERCLADEQDQMRLREQGYTQIDMGEFDRRALGRERITKPLLRERVTLNTIHGPATQPWRRPYHREGQRTPWEQASCAMEQGKT